MSLINELKKSIFTSECDSLDEFKKFNKLIDMCTQKTLSSIFKKKWREQSFSKGIDFDDLIDESNNKIKKSFNMTIEYNEITIKFTKGTKIRPIIYYLNNMDYIHVTLCILRPDPDNKLVDCFSDVYRLTYNNINNLINIDSYISILNLELLND